MEMIRTAKFEDADHDDHLNLSLGLPGSEAREKQPPRINKRALPEDADQDSRSSSKCGRSDGGNGKTQVVGWPPIRSYRKNNTQTVKKTPESDVAAANNYVKVSVDGAPYLRKIDLRVYKSYPELLKALENMFQLTIGKRSD